MYIAAANLHYALILIIMGFSAAVDLSLSVIVVNKELRRDSYSFLSTRIFPIVHYIYVHTNYT
jgi:hypothetical protein